MDAADQKLFITLYCETSTITELLARWCCPGHVHTLAADSKQSPPRGTPPSHHPPRFPLHTGKQAPAKTNVPENAHEYHIRGALKDAAFQSLQVRVHTRVPASPQQSSARARQYAAMRTRDHQAAAAGKQQGMSVPNASRHSCL